MGARVDSGPGRSESVGRPGRAVEPTDLTPARRGFRQLVLAVVLVSLGAVSLAGCGGSEPSTQETGTDTGSREVAAVDYTPISYEAVDAVTGEPVSMDQLRGRPALISSWATWCAPCRKELPALERFHREQGDGGVQVVIVNLDSAGNDSAVADFVDEFGLTMTQWRDADDAFTRTFKGLGIPMSVLVDHEGAAVERWYGALDPEDPEVAGRIEEVLAAAPSD